VGWLATRSCRSLKNGRLQAMSLLALLVLWLALFTTIASGVEATSDSTNPTVSTLPSSDAPSFYRQLAEHAAKATGIPPEIAQAVMVVESAYHPDAIGSAGEVGLMQVLPATARMMGFTGTDTELMVPETNIHYGVEYLAQAWRLAGKDLCTTAMKYRAGHGEERFSVKSVDYCIAVRAELLAHHYPVTGSVPVPTFGDFARSSARPQRCRPLCLAGASPTLPDLAPLNRSLIELVSQTRPHSLHGL